MYDAVLYNIFLAEERSDVLTRLGVEPGGYALVTAHRPRNTDDPARLRAIIAALEEIGRDLPVVFPVLPRTRHALANLPPATHNLRLIEPVGYLDMLMLEKHACLILTDSGGVQKEAYLFAVPCVTLREETEWVETVQAGWNVLVGADREAIVRAAREFRPVGSPPPLFGDGHASERIVEIITAHG